MAEHRREVRQRTFLKGRILFNKGASSMDCLVRDMSASGARLAVPEGMELPERFMFRVIGRDFVCAVKVVWRRGSHVGVQIERVGKLEAKAVKQPEPEAAVPEASGGAIRGLRGSRISAF